MLKKNALPSPSVSIKPLPTSANLHPTPTGLIQADPVQLTALGWDQQCHQLPAFHHSLTRSRAAWMILLLVLPQLSTHLEQVMGLRSVSPKQVECQAFPRSNTIFLMRV